MKKTDILAISDPHLGSEDCNTEKLMKTLRGYDYRKLVIVGDLSQEGEIAKEQFEVLGYLSDNREKITVVDGNHDLIGETLLHNRLGIEVVKKYETFVNNKRFCFIHGHRQFDRICFIFSEPLVDKLFCYLIKIFSRVTYIKKWLDYFHESISLHFAKKAGKYARKRGYDTVICGHTHMPLHMVFDGKKGKRIEYFNCGTFTGNICTFITIDKQGNTELHWAN